MHWISVRFNEIGDMWSKLNLGQTVETKQQDDDRMRKYLIYIYKFINK